MSSRRLAEQQEEPGESVAARLTIPARAFARYEDGPSRWVWPAGEYTSHAGRSSRDLRLSSSLTVHVR
ncbi:MAG TPA: fibronectin type III-like domain-contianing protein [Candidatus Dormibacteraeota bacterium]|nr:fibronectin type III-like domain-contianing protein [Candidatus Dormibacteraeota bacterium]